MILIALGSSLPFCGLPPHETVKAAVRAVGAQAGVLAVSRSYRSPAWPDPSDPPFVNAVVSVRFPGSPEDLIDRLHRIEASFGRRRGARNAPRTLDLDLIAFGDLVLKGGKGGLVLPHPRLEKRDFVLAPLCDIAPGWRHPVLGRSAADLLKALFPVRAAPLAP